MTSFIWLVAMSACFLGEQHPLPLPLLLRRRDRLIHFFDEFEGEAALAGKGHVSMVLPCSGSRVPPATRTRRCSPILFQEGRWNMDPKTSIRWPFFRDDEQTPQRVPIGNEGKRGEQGTLREARSE